MVCILEHGCLCQSGQNRNIYDSDSDHFQVLLVVPNLYTELIVEVVDLQVGLG